LTADSPEQAVELLDDAFNRGDLEAILRLYDEAALVLPIPGIQARGAAEVRELYGRLLHPSIKATQENTRVIQADGIALFVSRWTLHIEGQESEQHAATVVLRQQTDGSWKVLLDNPRGLAILDEI
jgi:uncharacterized protein (TIGR02246 family)